MALFQCSIIDANGKKKEFVKEANSEQALVLELTQQKIYPLNIREVKQAPGSKSSGRSFSSSVVLDFTETMSMLLTSGLSLKDALQIIRTIFDKGPIKRLCDTLDDRIRKGDSFQDALSRFRSSFPPLYIGLVRIGQKVGSLDNILKKLAGYLDQNKKLQGKLKGALTYPLLILGVAVVLLVAMITFILPRIRNIFSSLGSAVSDQINRSFAMANIFIISGLVIILGGMLLVLLINFIRKSDSPLAAKIDEFILKIPFAGKVIFTQEALNFLFAMETLTASGFSVEDALAEAAQVFKNKALLQCVLRIKARIIKGDHLSAAFLREKVFAERIGRWISIGERSGNIQVVFAQLRNYYQDDIDKWTTRFMNIIEPALIVLVGALVLVMVLVFFIPIYSIYQAI